MLHLAVVNNQRVGNAYAIYNDGKFITVVKSNMLLPTLKKWIGNVKEEYKPLIDNAGNSYSYERMEMLIAKRDKKVAYIQELIDRIYDSARRHHPEYAEMTI